MAAEQSKTITMPPTLTVLQLDTDFPRIAGDVGARETYLGDIEILRIKAATVAKVVTNKPQDIDIAPFEAALHSANGELIVTSCGFLSYWQNHLAARTQKPFISSSLIALDTLAPRYSPEELLILTFDAHNLGNAHLGAHQKYASSILGLPQDCHLRRVISENHAHLDIERAQNEISAHVAAHIRPKHRHILLECTNLPPYKAALTKRTGLHVSDILTLIENLRTGTINPAFLGSNT